MVVIDTPEDIVTLIFASGIGAIDYSQWQGSGVELFERQKR
jgi:hypothetical protein